MAKELQFPDLSPDPRVVAALEPVLAPAQDTPAYWDGLHRRIMARVADAGAIAWWSISPAAARAGLVAAGLAILALGALALQTRELNNRIAFEAVAETELEVARVIPGIDEPIGSPQRR